jgi:IclR family pca regulon transcriptional regulator
LSVSDVAELVGITRTVARRFILTLEYLGYLSYDASVIIGTSLPAYAKATGRVLLSGLTDEGLDEYLESLVPESLTGNTAIDGEVIRKRIISAREQGWSLADQELAEGLRSIAVPVRDAGGGIIAALNVSAHAARVSAESLRDTVLPRLLTAAAAVETDFAADG